MSDIDVDISTNNCAQLSVAPLEGRGRGVLAMAKIQEASVIEVAPLLLVPRQELMGSLLREYVFSYKKKDRSLSAVGLGYASIYNHSFDSNAKFRVMKDRIVFTAKRDIEEGEEICINYDWSPQKYYSKGVISEEEFDALKDAMKNQQQYKPRDGLRLQEVDGELVILHKKRGKIHQLNPTARVVWQTIAEHGSLMPAIALAAMTKSFDVDPDTAATDLETLIQQFIELKLINPVD